MNANSPTVPPVITPPPPAIPSVPPPRFKFLLAVAVWLCVVLAGIGVTWILPEMYASAVRLQILPKPELEPYSVYQAVMASVHDPDFVNTQVRVIVSEVVLTRVMDELDLSSVWGKKYSDGQKLKTSECIALMRARLEVRPYNRGVIDIRGYSESAQDAATLANAVAQAYCRWRADDVSRRVRDMVNELEKQLALQEQKVERIKGELADLAKAAEATPQGSPQELTYTEKQKAFELESDVSQLIRRRLDAEKLNLQLPLAAKVEILDRAVPAVKPVRPNVPLNIILSIVMGALFGAMVALLVYLVQWRTYRQKLAA